MNRRKKQYRGNNFIASERAVALSLGFVMLAGICITAFCLVMAASLPFWTKTFEAAHASAVADEFCDLATEINGTITVAKEGGQNAAGTSVIKMKPDRVPVIGISPPGSCLEVRPDNEQLNITPYIGASPIATTVYNFSWIENTTANFSNYTKKANVDTNFDTIKLSRVDIADNLTITNTTTALTGVHYYDKVEIRNSTVYLIPNKYLKLYANTIYIDATSRIIADECGYLGGDGGNLGAGPGFGRYGYNGSGGGGAGYAGAGGAGGLRNDSISGRDEGDGGFSYGDNTSLSFVLGSGGAGGGCGEGIHGVSHQGEPGGYGGNGGGAVLLNAPQINIYGNISANGAAGSAGIGADLSSGGGGGGSGGIIIIQGGEVNLSSATLSANGGEGGTGGIGQGPGDGGGGGGGGAGGRIKIFYGNASLYGSSTPTHHEVKGIGGDGGGGKTARAQGSNGTTGIFYENQTAYDSEAFYEDSGYYESRVFDTENSTTCYGNISWNSTTNDDTEIKVKLRTSIHEEIEGNSTLWGNCDTVTSGQNLTDLTSVFDCHQYIQYRVELSTYDTTQTPEFTGIRINFHSSDPAGGSPVVAESSGAIKFTSGHIYYPKQEITYEHGAVIKSQNANGDQQGLIIQPPPINITNQTGPTINISMIDLTGSSDSYSGTATASLENAYKTYDSFSTEFDNLTLNLSTEYPTVWGKWFNDTLEESGLTPNCYNVTVNETYVATEFYGHGPRVQLNVEKAVVGVKL